MKSINFEMLRPNWPDLASLGGFAEQYALPDPSSSLVKLRSFAEVMVQIIYRQLQLPKPDQPNLIDLLNSGGFVGFTLKVILDKLHAIRIHGNKAAHGETGSTKLALQLVQQAYDLARWFIVKEVESEIPEDLVALEEMLIMKSAVYELGESVRFVGIAERQQNRLIAAYGHIRMARYQAHLTAGVYNFVAQHAFRRGMLCASLQ